jgi:hypothetical protein
MNETPKPEQTTHPLLEKVEVQTPSQSPKADSMEQPATPVELLGLTNAYEEDVQAILKAQRHGIRRR